MKKIIISCGGTGGHIYPGIAVGQKLRETNKDIDILFVGAVNGMEEKIVLKENFKFSGISCGKMFRKITYKNIHSAVKVMKGIVESKKIVEEFMPDVILGTGAYVCAPVCIAGWIKRIPVVLHEQNSIPGLTNKLLSRIARQVFTSYRESTNFFYTGRALYTGNPVRKEIGTYKREQAVKNLHLDGDKKTILIVGGSQGAHKLNQIFFGVLSFLEKEKIQILWMTGDKDYTVYKDKVKDLKIKVVVSPFFSNIAEVYGATDLVVGRSGASTIAEIIKCGIPAILLPYPHAANNHQYYNASYIVSNGAGILIEENNVTPEILAKEIMNMVKNDNRLEIFSNNMKRLGGLDAVLNITRELKKYL